MDLLTWLQNWYQRQCGDQHEPGDGIQMGTLDNPGWFLSVNLKGTLLLEKEFKDITIDRSEHDWVHCFVKDGRFEGSCGPFNFAEVLQTLHDWVEGD